MTTSFIALGIATSIVIGMVIGLGVLSLVFGTLDTFFGKARLKILKNSEFDTGFAFFLNWNAAKTPAKIDTVQVRLFNPHGSPTQLDVTRSFDGKGQSFVTEVDMGKSYLQLLGAEGLETARVQVELSSSTEGVVFQFEYPGAKFKQMLEQADKTVATFIGEEKPSFGPKYNIPDRNFIADEGIFEEDGPQLAIATNPAFEAYFKNMGGGAGGAAAADTAAKENFAVSKVWIEPGCIVCNACEDIYPEVFDVQADTCYIRPNAPLDDGLRIEESADACPVEVIKFTKAV